MGPNRRHVGELIEQFASLADFVFSAGLAAAVTASSIQQGLHFVGRHSVGNAALRGVAQAAAVVGQTGSRPWLTD